MTDIEVTLTYSEQEAQEVIRAIRYFNGNVSATYQDHDRMTLIRSAITRALPPPRPEEPTGLGAVVEDEDGSQYVLVTGDDEAPWAKVPAGEWQIECFGWHEFAAVRILSEGVSA